MTELGKQYIIVWEGDDFETLYNVYGSTSDGSDTIFKKAIKVLEEKNNYIKVGDEITKENDIFVFDTGKPEKKKMTKYQIMMNKTSSGGGHKKTRKRRRRRRN